MTIAKRIREAADTNPDAKARLDAVTEIMSGLVRRCCGDGAETGAASDLIRLAALEAMEAVLRPPKNGATAAPPWSPPRYHLPNERPSLTKALHLEGIAGTKVAVGFYDSGEPAEIFVSKEGESTAATAYLDALATAISIGLQYGIDWEVFSTKLERWTFEPRGFTGDDHEALRTVSSPLDYVIRAAHVLVERRRAQKPTDKP
ncbi:MAG: hypothetical protein GTN69_10595 [Armatimonadetes bacterium]|nr:hypothetical protein [Armatimonadota bacterium]